MGAANVVPGVSGGTIAFVTGIYEEFIDSLKSFNLEALKLLFKGRFGELLNYINAKFLVVLFTGITISIVTLGKVLKILIEKSDVLVSAFFFGLILASIYIVAKMVKKWNLSSIISLIVGTGIAVSLAFIKPASENSSMIYLFICGIAAMSSMILPGLSGSFVLILLGNYQLIMLEAASNPVSNIKILAPVIIGAIVGFLLLSHAVSYLLDKFYDITVSLLTGFILGSLLIIWPWKQAIYLMDNVTKELILKKGEKIVSGYTWHLPDFSTSTANYAVLLIIAGAILVLAVEKIGNKKMKENA